MRGMTNSNFNQKQVSWVAIFEIAINLLGGQTEAGRILGISQQRVYFILKKAKKFPSELLVRVEQATDGQITRSDLSPELFEGVPHGIHYLKLLTSGHPENKEKFPVQKTPASNGVTSCAH